MGSYLIHSFYFIYGGKLYRFEEWDEDYRGCCTYVNEVDDFVTTLCLDESWPDVPVVIDMSAVRDKDKRVGMIFQNLHESSGDLLKFAGRFAEQNISVYPRWGILHDLSPASLSVHLRSREARYDTALDRSTRLDFLCSVFGISRQCDSSSYVEHLILCDDATYRIRVLCPEYAIVQGTNDGRFSVLDLRGVKEATVYDHGGAYIPTLDLRFATYSRHLDYDQSRGRTAVISY